jgi:hypothetical protein
MPAALKGPFGAVGSADSVVPTPDNYQLRDIKFTSQLTWDGTPSAVPRRRMANAAGRSTSVIRAARSRQAVHRETRKLLRGDHIPYVTDAALRKQLSAVFGADNLGHSVLTVAPQRVAPAAGGEGELQVLVTRDDPDARRRHCHRRPRRGDRRTSRPQTRRARRCPARRLHGAITTLDDTKADSNYFARLAS